MENCPFIVDLPIKIVIFHSYVSLPDGNPYVFYDIPIIFPSYFHHIHDGSSHPICPGASESNPANAWPHPMVVARAPEG